MTIPFPSTTIQPDTNFLGLAPFLRMSITGSDFVPLVQNMLTKTEETPDDANLWMNLSTAMLCLKQTEVGLAMQAHALEKNRIYHLPALQKPAIKNLLILMVAGDLAANTPLDCLLENSDLNMDFYYVSLDDPLSWPIPDHDALLVAISEADENMAILRKLEKILSNWQKPVLNKPQFIPNTERSIASLLLRDIPGLLIPQTLRTSRNTLLESEDGIIQTENENSHSINFPIILRPVGSHAGRNLEKMNTQTEVLDYLSKVKGDDFFLSKFIDYSNEDGLFRKYRIALIDGKAYACHMAISSNWMIHYLNAGMYEDAQKRLEEASFMEHFDIFYNRHKVALDEIYCRTNLDYLCIDCAETRDGQLFIFEIDHAMIVHAMDPEDQFPYKKQHIQKIKMAFRELVLRLSENYIS